MKLEDTTVKTPQTAQARPVRRDDVVCRELDGESLIYDPRCGALHRLNVITFLVWKACNGSHTTADIAASLTMRYAVDADEALAYAERIVEQFRLRGLLQDSPHEPRSGRRRSCERKPAATARSRDVETTESYSLSRRRLLSGGVSRLVFVAPVISTFLASGARAQTTAASGPDGCKNTGYSCTADGDCCVSQSKCQDGLCCVKKWQACTTTADCCDQWQCNGGVCN